MRTSALNLIALLTLFTPVSVYAQTVSPRDAVGGVGKAIADNYFDAARGAAIAADLNTAAAQGEFDALTDARELAHELTKRLNPLDRHFRVDWSAPAPIANASSDAPPPQIVRPPFLEVARKANFGFKRVEILPGNIGVITLSRFFPIDFDDPRTPARLTADAALRMVADADAIIIDLRDNGGGDPTMVGYLASAFLPTGLDAYNVFQTREGVSREAPGQTYAEPRAQTPVIILVSGRTGSAAEGLSYTLQAAGRAVIVGEPTRGAANPGGPVDASDGLSVFVPTGSPRNPITGGNWEGTGVRPDIEIPAAEALETGYRRALEAALTTLGAGPSGAEARWTLESLVSPTVTLTLADYSGQYGGAAVTDAGVLLNYQDGRRPPRAMKAIGSDLFSDLEDPTRRVRFVRDASGAVTALELLGPYGDVNRRSLDRQP